MNKKILFLILLAVLFLPAVAFGQTITGIVINIKDVVVNVAGWVVVICWVITGFLFLAAQGDPSQLNKAKIALFTSIAGTILVVIAVYAKGLIATSFGL